MHVPEPDKNSEERDQREFDQAVDKTGKMLLQVLAGVGIVAALIMAAVALVQSGERGTSVQPAVGQTLAAHSASALAPAASAGAQKVLDVKIMATYKATPDGVKHDAFTRTDFAVKVGQPLRLRIDNTDNAAHSITSPVLGVNIVAKPGIHTYTLQVDKAGKFQWYCMIPCDSDSNGWAMQHPGFMSGYITAS
jgi:heme/copper-type cytochrome/quinol oxidase subunit 2